MSSKCKSLESRGYPSVDLRVLIGAFLHRLRAHGFCLFPRRIGDPKDSKHGGARAIDGSKEMLAGSSPLELAECYLAIRFVDAAASGRFPCIASELNFPSLPLVTSS